MALIHKLIKIQSEVINTFDLEILKKLKKEVEDILNFGNKKEVEERETFLQSLLEEIEDKIKKICDSKYYRMYFVAYFHAAKFFDHSHEEWQEGAVKHPRKNWVVVTQPNAFKYAGGVTLKDGELFPVIRNVEEIYFFSTRKEQVRELYNFLAWKKSLVKKQDFEIQENNDTIVIYPVKEKKGFFIGPKGEHVKFVSRALQKKVIIK